MIKTWSLNNFKSYKDKIVIPLAPINVLAGANSSGKSSIIQSILLLKQTLQYGSANRPLSLNGPLLRLGGFNDVRNFEADGEELRLGMEFSFSPEEIKHPTPWNRHLSKYHSGVRGESLVGLSVDLAFADKQQSLDVTTASTNLTPTIAESSIRTKRRSESGSTTENYIVMRRRTNLETDDEEAPSQYWKQESELDTESFAVTFADKPEASLAGGVYQYFLPSWVAVRYNFAARNVIQTIDKIFERQSFSWIADLDDEIVPPPVIELVNMFLIENGEVALPLNDQVPAAEVQRKLAKFIRSGHSFDLFADRPMMTVKASIEVLKETVHGVWMSLLTPDYSIDFESPPIVGLAKEFVQEFFKSGIRYLGPLRDSPRPVYQLEALESTTDVGYRGEHTAAILDLNSSRRISYHRPPSEFLSDEQGTVLSPASASLHDAVVEWLTYLGVATEVATTDAGVFGNRLQVSTSTAGRLHDLTNVGVGVSQVLPIVVMALLAPRGSFLIFEQPELHLHPKVQARLADFLYR